MNPHAAMPLLQSDVPSKREEHHFATEARTCQLPVRLMRGRAEAVGRLPSAQRSLMKGSKRQHKKQCSHEAIQRTMRDKWGHQVSPTHTALHPWLWLNTTNVAAHKLFGCRQGSERPRPSSDHVATNFHLTLLSNPQTHPGNIPQPLPTDLVNTTRPRPPRDTPHCTNHHHPTPKEQRPRSRT